MALEGGGAPPEDHRDDPRRDLGRRRRCAARSSFAPPATTARSSVADLVRGDGAPVTVSFTSFPLFENGAYTGSVSLDMTELRDAEGRRAESEERFRRLAEGAADAIYRYRLGPEARLGPR
jgi:PAS domain-containing protein